MGIQDRDWYREEMKARKRAEDEEAARRTPPWSKKNRIPVDLLDKANPPKLWGADWHWSIQLLVWLCIAVLMLAAWRLLK